MTTTKDTNPKDVVGGTKLPLDLVPSSVEVFAAMAFCEGALKYGKFNWRVAGVRMSVYISAIKRHLKKLEDGEWADPVTRVPHISSIIACAGIIGDASLCDKLTDDRAPAAPSPEFIDRQVELVAHLKDLFAEHNPKQFTIEDSDRDYQRIDRRVLSEVPCITPSKERASGPQPRSPRSGEGW